jgi:hypothetical protein
MFDSCSELLPVFFGIFLNYSEFQIACLYDEDNNTQSLGGSENLGKESMRMNLLELCQINV